MKKTIFTAVYMCNEIMERCSSYETMDEAEEEALAFAEENGLLFEDFDELMQLQEHPVMLNEEYFVKRNILTINTRKEKCMNLLQKVGEFIMQFKNYLNKNIWINLRNKQMAV